MEFLRRNINKQSRNGDIISSSISSSYIGGGTNNSGGGVSGNYLPATKNDENIYIVPHYVTFQETTTTTDIDGNETETIKNLLEITSNGIIVNGDIIATGEVAAYSSGLTNGGTSGGGSVTVYDGLDSNAIDVALSANQGKVLNNKITDLSNQINGASTTLSALTDTNISNVSNGQILVYDGTTTKWINKTFDLESSAVTKHIADTTIHITADERTKWNKASDSVHSHSNISVLSGITSTKVSNWDKASTSAHSHSNKTVIDGITSDLINKWNSAYTHISDSVTHVTESDKTKWNNKLDKSIWDSAFYFDSSNNLRVKINLIGEKEVSAYGSGSSSSSGAITIVDNLTSTLQDAALSANQGRVLKDLIDNIDVGNLDLSDYSRTGHTHTIANITNLQTALDGKSPTSHTHTQYASSSHTHAISAVTNLQTALDGKSGTGHTHSTYSVTSHTHPQYASSSHTHNYASIVKVGSTSYNISGNTISLPSYPTLSSLSGVSTSTFNTHSGNTTLHITATERTNWNKAYTNNHTHSNKSVLDGITSTKVSNWDTVYSNWNKAFSFDTNGNLKVSVNVIGEGEISAYGSGTSSSSGAITIVDNLTSTLTDAALSANQGRVLKNLIDNIDVGNLDLSDYSRTGHTHTIANITNLQSTLDGKSGTGHTHSNYSPTSHTHSNYSLTSHTHSTYYDSAVSRTKNTVLAAPNGSAGSATFRALVAADIPSLAISKITNLQSTLDSKSSTSHTHSNYSLTSHTHSAYATTGHTHSSLTFSGGTFSAKTYNPSGATTVNIPTSTSHLTNNSGYITSAATVAAANKVTSTLTFSGGTFSANTFNGSAAKTIYIPTNTTHLTNGSGYITSAATVAAANKVTSTLTFTTGATSTGSYNGSSAVTIKIPSNTTHLTNGSGFITSAATVANSNKFSGYTMRSAATWVNNSVEAYIQYTIDATSLSTSNFYPIIFPTTQKDLYVRMYSTAGSSSAAYNQNKLEFTFRRTRMERYSTRFNSTFL